MKKDGDKEAVKGWEEVKVKTDRKERRRSQQKEKRDIRVDKKKKSIIMGSRIGEQNSDNQQCRLQSIVEE